MDYKASARDVVTTGFQADHDESSDLLDLVKYLNAESIKTALETKIKDGDDLATPLIIAARDGKLDFVKVLLRYEANIEARGTSTVEGRVVEDCTALWIAAAKGHFDVVRLLIEQSAEVDSRTSVGSTPLRAAAFFGHLDIVRCLVENGADVNARENFNSTPLMITCYKGHPNVASYLVKHGANINLQDNKGESCLHYALDGDHVQLACKLLALGAKQTRNLDRLTPLLLASDNCKIEMVERFINRPECSKEERIDALELLGATIANDSKAYDIEKAFSFMKRGMEERYEDPSCPLLKKKMEPVEAYQNRTESQTLDELSLLEGDDHAIQIEGLMIRERILGTDNTILRYPIRCRGAVLADCKKYELCIGLWTRAIEIALNCNVQITKDLESFTDVIAEMVQNGHSLSSQAIENIFEKFIDIKTKLSEKLKSGELEEEHQNEAQETLLFNALYLLVMYTKVQVSSEWKNGNMIDLLQRFLCLEPCTLDGNTLLHLAAWHKTPVPRDTRANWRGVCELPCVETMKLILHAGCDVNSVNAQGNTPLHLAVTFVPGPEQVDILKEMLELLLDLGADTKLVDKNGQTVMDCCETDDARCILSAKGRLGAISIEARKDEVTGSGVDEGRGERFVPETEKDVNENVKRETKETSGIFRELTQQRENVRPRNRDEELREMTQKLKNVRRQLQERDGQLSEKDRQLRERDEQLREKTQQLTNTQAQLQERDGEMREKTQHLKKVEEQLQEKDEEVSSLERRLEEKEQQVDELEDSLSAASQALNKLSRQQSPDWVIPRDQIQLTEKCLGRGGWGIVVKGKYCGCTVAVKQIYDDLLKSSSYYRELFEREMNIASRCRHPCLLQFIGATNDEGTPLFVTELMETSLRALSEQRSLSPTEVYVISLDVAQALNYLHLKKPSPIIHRDISTANVLLWREADQWRGKVSDYGTANFKRDIMTACPGSRIYSAPEALTKSQTAKVDVYSFGVLLCEICTRKLPDPDRRDEQVAMVKNRTLRALIRRCLKRAPEARPSMEDIIGELEQSMLD